MNVKNLNVEKPESEDDGPTKLCRGCGETKSLEKHFVKHLGNINGYQTQCRKCNAEARRANYAKTQPGDAIRKRKWEANGFRKKKAS